MGTAMLVGNSYIQWGRSMNTEDRAKLAAWGHSLYDTPEAQRDTIYSMTGYPPPIVGCDQGRASEQATAVLGADGQWRNAADRG